MKTKKRYTKKEMLAALKDGNHGDIARLEDWAAEAWLNREGDTTSLWARLERHGLVYRAGDRYLLN
jgi:hypothetical protein